MSSIAQFIASVFLSGIQLLAFLKPIIVGIVFAWVAFVAIVFLAVTKLKDFNRFSRMGKLIFYSARYSANVIKKVRSSRFYYPLKGLTKFDPSLLMLVLGGVLVVYIVGQFFDSLALVFQSFGTAVALLGSGLILAGLWRLIGAILITGLVFLLGMMLLMFMNFLFGFLGGPARFAARIINPFLRVVEGAGVSPNWSFFLLYVILTIFQMAFIGIFF